MQANDSVLDVFNLVKGFLPVTEEKGRHKFSFQLFAAHWIDQRTLYRDMGVITRETEICDALTIKYGELGVEHVAPIVYQYLKDESNTQDELEFLQGIK